MTTALYQAYQLQRDLAAPLSAWGSFTVASLERMPEWISESPGARWLRASAEMVGSARPVHDRPSFGIDEVASRDGRVAVAEEVIDTTPFGTLIHFAKRSADRGPSVLVVAALAGHFSTLLRPTVKALLRDHDVYITDWHNARDVPVDAGQFGFDDYVDHVMRFIRKIGPGVHVVSVCQPCPATLVATALMAEDSDPSVPRSLTLMAGPVDARVSPTDVNRLAMSLPLAWFEQWAIATVPGRYGGAGRRVYPGFLQLSGFMGMNPERHVDQGLERFFSRAAGEDEAADSISDFYREYLAVLDVTAEFYLETVDRVFQRHLLATGEHEWRGRRVDPGAIASTALMTVEGGRDDICGLGQTQAAQDLCGSIPAARRRHHLQPNVGHYGVFGGSTWESQIAPEIASFIQASD